MRKTINGSCLCNAITYRFSGPELVFQYCHCSRCRKFSGSAHSANIIVRPNQFEWLSGEDLIGRFELPEAKYFATCFCTRCGSSLPWLTRNNSAVVIPAGTLDEDPGIKPAHNIFWHDRAPWREEVQDLAQFDELPEK